MFKINTAHCIVLYNRGKLTPKSDVWFYKWGYRVIRKDGKVVDIVPDVA